MILFYHCLLGMEMNYCSYPVDPFALYFYYDAVIKCHHYCIIIFVLFLFFFFLSLMLSNRMRNSSVLLAILFSYFLNSANFHSPSLEIVPFIPFMFSLLYVQRLYSYPLMLLVLWHRFVVLDRCIKWKLLPYPWLYSGCSLLWLLVILHVPVHQFSWHPDPAPLTII